VAAIPYVVAGAFPVLLCLALTAYGQHPLAECYLHVFALDARKLRPDEQVSLLVQDVERRANRIGWVSCWRPLVRPTLPNTSSKRRFTSLCGS
jgi:hypothetical protein